MFVSIECLLKYWNTCTQQIHRFTHAPMQRASYMVWDTTHIVNQDIPDCKNRDIRLFLSLLNTPTLQNTRTYGTVKYSVPWRGRILSEGKFRFWELYKSL